MRTCVDCGERHSGVPRGCRACPSGSRILPALPIAVLVGSLALAAVVGGPRLIGAERPRAEQPVRRDAAPALENLPANLVTVDPRVTHPRTVAVVAMLDTYFHGINQRDYRAVATVLDPAGDVDPGVPGELEAFAEGTSTSLDSDIVLVGLTDAAYGRLRAEVSFRSEQKAGHGPPGRPRETCTLWQVTYLLTVHGDGYRMLRGDGLDQPC
ncbi:hypothetical protein Aph02nite_21020 [Actinoplanes philippinensis]|uniref:Uncharacterized protein n=1 Tax=Actinoplanes philippinensis TaxID=35752 RepID=A0A1I2BWE0_9ACTN|nr:hypothetical protein [Actinoplanes philippinensis]GIE76152.1 hypothetical protein Aph02nite_21020 [Actinoplanes philippinensis]SFE60397.1 hypothetical protein SAMN05421541_102567 [Actinoplanes philippinensis]